MFTSLLLAGFSLGSMMGAGADADQPDADTRPPQHITIPENYNTPFDAEAGDTVTVIMDDTPGWQTRCEQMGGIPTVNQYTSIELCDNIDF
ncbi:MAG: hypothetical protein ABWZ17_06380 [Candidatus Binatia bacterium]